MNISTVDDQRQANIFHTLITQYGRSPTIVSTTHTDIVLISNLPTGNGQYLGLKNDMEARIQIRDSTLSRLRAKLAAKQAAKSN